MLRSVLGVIIGYIAIALIVFTGLTTAWLILGADGAFEPGVYEISTTWGAAAIAVNLIAAIIGGVVCMKIARQRGAVITFAAIVFILGLIVAIPTITAEETEPAARPDDVSMAVAMRDAEQPVWFCLMNPVTAALGIMIGGMLIPARRKAANATNP
jgi:hypothetical protein